MTRALALSCVLALAASCPNELDDDDDGAGEGEGEGDARAEGEGEGDGGEGEGGEGEGEGEGEPDPGPQPSGCVDDVSSGDHAYECDGYPVDARIPAACQAAGACGLILELHGDTGDGPLIDGHLRMFDLGEANDFIVIAPTGPPFGFGNPGSTWSDNDDDALVGIVELFADVFRVDRARIHVTGFSRGAFVTWRLLCDHAELFASAAPAGAGNGFAFGEPTCFDAAGRVPSRAIPIVFLMGRTDAAVGFTSLTRIRDDAVDEYGASGPVVVDGDADYSHERWTDASGAVVIETFEHSYETDPAGPFGDAQGHCIPGSLSDPFAAQYAIPCVLPNAFTWGDEVMQFFLAHPMP